MRTFLAGLVLLTLVGVSPAAEPTARERVERILTDPAADLTAEVNALIAMGPDRVRPVLDELFVRMRVKRSAASGYRAEVESLVAVLAGTDADYEPPRWDLGSRFAVVEGVVLRFDNAPDGGGWSGNLHFSWEPPKDPLGPIEDAWRKPLTPDRKALFARILDPDDALRDKFAGYRFWRSVAQILAVAGDDAPERLRERCAEELPSPDERAGGDATILPLLERAKAGPGVSTIEALRTGLRQHRRWRVRSTKEDAILESFRLGLSLLETGPEKTRGAAIGLLRSILRGRGELMSAATVAETARRVLDDLSAGRLRITTTPRREPQIGALAGGPFSDIVRKETDAVYRDEYLRAHPTLVDPGYARHLHITLRRNGNSVELSIHNAGDRVVVLNRTGLEYGLARWTPKDNRLHLPRGHPPLSGVTTVPAAGFASIAPGGEFSTALPLPEGVTDEADITVFFEDHFAVDGDLPGIRLVRFLVRNRKPPPAPDDAHLVVRPVDGNGEPVHGAAARLFPEPIAAGWSRHQGSVLLPRDGFPDDERHGRRAAGGRRYFDRLGTGLWRLVVRAPGRAPTERTLATAWGVTPGEVEVVMEPAARLSGRVLLDGETPLADVEVAAVRVGTSITPASTAFDFRALTDWGGRYRIEEMAPGDYDLFTRRDGRVWILGPRLRLPAISRFDITVTDGAVITGVVTARGETGRPVAGARVELLPDGPNEALLDVAETDEEGYYVLRTQRRFVNSDGIRVLADGFARRHIPARECTNLCVGDRHTIDVALAPEARIGGLVTTPNGFGGGAEVRVWFRSDSPFHREFEEFEAIVVKADGLGNWSVGGLAPGDVAVQVVVDGFRHPGWEKSRTSPGMTFKRTHFPASSLRTLTVGENDDFDVELVPIPSAERHHHSLRGIVVDGKGRPVPLARISESGGEETLSDVEGRFEISGFEKLQVTASKPGYASAWTTQDPDEPESDEAKRIVLVRRPLLRGRVVSKVGGSVAGATVHVGRKLVRNERYLYADWEIVPGSTVAADGSFAIPIPALEIYPGWGSEYLDEYVVCVEAKGHAAGFSALFCLGEKPKDVTLPEPIELGAGHTVEGRADHYGTDRPAAGIPVSLEPAEGAWNEPGWPPTAPPSPGNRFVAVTNGEGRFRIPNLVAGRYEVGLGPAGRNGDVAEIALPAKEPVRLFVRALLPLAGIVTGPRKDPLPGARVTLEDEDGDLRSHPPPILTGPDGRFRFEGVPAGRWHLVVTTDAALGPRRVGPVSAGKTDVSIALQSPRRITGRLLDPEGRPMVGVTVYARPTTPNLPWARTGTDGEGRFELWRLGEGLHDVEFADLFVTVRGIRAGGTLEFRARGTLTIAGHVLLPSEAERLSSPSLRLVRLDPEEDPRVVRRPVAWVEDSGTFEFPHLPPGRYRLVIDEESRREWRLDAEPVIEAGKKDVVVRVHPTQGR